MSAAIAEERTYRQRINAWTLYDWANSAFATTVMAAVLPIYYSDVAGANLPSKAMATAYWGLGLSVSLLIVALLSPILGTISDVMRGKKRFLSIFAGLGIVATGLLALVSTGDLMLASLLFVLGRVGFSGANVFYDALLPHVAREEDRDRVSTRGYAMGYLGGGLLLAVNAVMLIAIPGTWGARLSFLSVAVWWAVFSIPIFRWVPEPPAAAAELRRRLDVVTISARRLWETFKDIRHYRELFKYLIAFLIYNDGIGTIISVAVIYGTELGFGRIELILALLLVQFVGIPFSLIFGRLPSPAEKRRPQFLAFILFNLVAVPLVGILGARTLPDEITGWSPPPYTGTARAVGQGVYPIEEQVFAFEGGWDSQFVSAKDLDANQDRLYAITEQAGAKVHLPFRGQQVKLTHSAGPDHGIWLVELDGQPLLDEATGAPLTVDGYNETVRYDEEQTFQAPEGGEHILSLVNSGERNLESQGTVMTLSQVEILPPIRQSSLPIIIGILVIIEVIGVLFAISLGRLLFSGLSGKLDTRRSIILALCVYAAIAIWGFLLDSVLEFWLLAWMVAIVQGGSQALSRSLYSSMSPAAKSGEFFGLYGIMEKFSAIIGPAIFAAAAVAFNSSRPAVLSLIVLFLVGIVLLLRVNVDEGRRVAQEEDARAGLA